MLDLPIDTTASVISPVRVCEITRTDGVTFFIADSEESVTIGSVNYTPLPGCDIGAVKHTIGGEVPSVLITFAHSDGGTLDTFELSAGFFDGAEVNLYVADRDNLAAGKGLIFRGTIQPVSIDIMGGGSFDCRGQAAQSETVIQTYQPMCRTDLYSSLCQVDPDILLENGQILSVIDQFNAELMTDHNSPPTQRPDGWFDGGVFVTEDGFAFEVARWTSVNANGNAQITTWLPICAIRLAAGMTFQARPGCDKTMGDQGCGRYSNWINFQGEPHYLGAAVAAVGG